MRTVKILADAEALAIEAAELIVRVAADSRKQRGRFTIALAGGSTPERTYAVLADAQNAGRIDWGTTYVFQSDERDVPADDPRSNFGLSQRALLSHVPIPASNVFPMIGEPGNVATSAERYAALLRDFFGGLPRFDLIVLGMGDDGHTASLFPGHPTVVERELWVVSSPPGALPPPVDRLTFTLPLINAAHNVLMLVSGEHKSDTVADIIEHVSLPPLLPASGVNPSVGTVFWFLDQAAASRLNPAAIPFTKEWPELDRFEDPGVTE
ncbi:MAG: 6-phosphogluconolactonase [Capsulimonadaceae bacterium]